MIGVKACEYVQKLIFENRELDDCIPCFQRINPGCVYRNLQ